MITPGLPVYVALEPVDMRFGYERLGGIVRERMQADAHSAHHDRSDRSIVIA